MERTREASPHRIARIAGIFYLLVFVTGLFLKISPIFYRFAAPGEL